MQLLQNIYSKKQLDIEINAPDRMMHCDREDMLELIGNLLDNACKWAQGKIHIDLNCDNGITIRVADDGPGCSEQAMQNWLIVAYVWMKISRDMAWVWQLCAILPSFMRVLWILNVPSAWVDCRLE